MREGNTGTLLPVGTHTYGGHLLLQLEFASLSTHTIGIVWDRPIQASPVMTELIEIREQKTDHMCTACSKDNNVVNLTSSHSR